MFKLISQILLAATIVTSQADALDGNGKTNGQIEDFSDFPQRFDLSGLVACEGPSIGAIWTGSHAVLKLQVPHERYRNLKDGSIERCRKYLFHTYPGNKGVALETEASGSILQFAISDSELEEIKNWLVEYDRKGEPWNIRTNNCIDFVFKAFKAVGYQAEILQWLVKFELGLTSSKIHFMKYVLTEDFPKSPSAQAWSFNPYVMLNSFFCDLIFNPIRLLLLPFDHFEE